MDNELIEKRLENIEEVLKMLLINDVLNGGKIEQIQENLLRTANATLLPLGLKNIRLNYIEKCYFLFAEVEEGLSLTAIKAIYSKVNKIQKEMKIVFAFDKLHPKRKKSFQEARISYYIKNGELNIF